MIFVLTIGSLCWSSYQQRDRVQQCTIPLSHYPLQIVYQKEVCHYPCQPPHHQFWWDALIHVWGWVLPFLCIYFAARGAIINLVTVITLNFPCLCDQATLDWQILICWFHQKHWFVMIERIDNSRFLGLKSFKLCVMNSGMHSCTVIWLDEFLTPNNLKRKITMISCN